MPPLTTQWTAAWAEDTALLRSNRSADPGTETEARAVHQPPGIFTFGISTHATNLRGTTPRPSDRMSPFALTNADQTEFQFTLNQDNVGACNGELQ